MAYITHITWITHMVKLKHITKLKNCFYTFFLYTKMPNEQNRIYINKTDLKEKHYTKLDVDDVVPGSFESK